MTFPDDQLVALEGPGRAQGFPLQGGEGGSRPLSSPTWAQSAALPLTIPGSPNVSITIALEEKGGKGEEGEPRKCWRREEAEWGRTVATSFDCSPAICQALRSVSPRQQIQSSLPPDKVDCDCHLAGGVAEIQIG